MQRTLRPLVISFCFSVLASQALHAQSPEGVETSAAPGAQTSAATAGRVADALMYALSMVGVKYRYGGNNIETGFDCSGFVHHVLGHIIAHTLPRQAEAMAKFGKVIATNDLLPGDLVFYNTRNRRYSHVGIYLGNGQFIHAPSPGKSIEVVEMTERYWQNRFNGGRRIVSNFAPVSIPQAVPDPITTASE